MATISELYENKNWEGLFDLIDKEGFWNSLKIWQALSDIGFEIILKTSSRIAMVHLHGKSF